MSFLARFFSLTYNFFLLFINLYLRFWLSKGLVIYVTPRSQLANSTKAPHAHTHSFAKKEREMALRAAVLRHVRVPLQAAPKLQPWRAMSSHGDDHLSKEEVVERVLAVVKDFPKVDPSRVCVFFFLPLSFFYMVCCFVIVKKRKEREREKRDSESWICWFFVQMGCPKVWKIEECVCPWPFLYWFRAQYWPGWCL